MDWKRVSTEIKRQFRRDGISLEAAAERLGISPQALTMRLSGRAISDSTAISLAKTFGFSERYILTGEGSLITKIETPPADSSSDTEHPGEPSPFRLSPETKTQFGSIPQGVPDDRMITLLMEMCQRLMDLNKDLQDENERLRAALRRAGHGSGYHSLEEFEK